MTDHSTLTQAFDQWSNRPADERFKSLEELHAATTHHRDVSVEAKEVSLKKLRIEAQGVPVSFNTDTGDPLGSLEGRSQPVLVGPNGNPATFAHYAFGQFCRNVGAPAGYLRRLPAELVAANLNQGIKDAESGEPSNLLFTQNGNLRLRSMVSQQYKRIWNTDVTDRLIRLVAQNPEWQPAPEAFDGSRGLYASDEDMFAFLVDNDRRIFETLPGGGLGRGFFVWNSEVGAASFGIMTFFYEYVCGNHRVWGASGVTELRIRHVGNADDQAFIEIAREVNRYAGASASDDETKIKAAMAFRLGDNKDEVLDKVFGLRGVDVPKKVLAQAFDRASDHNEWYGDPKSAWGFTGGLTEIARDLPNANDRVRLDRAAGKVMQIAF